MIWDTVVVGGGIAGLACARALAQSGRRITLIEAQHRLGGRILTDVSQGVPVELGAEFVHGKPAVLLDLLREAGLDIYERTGQFLHATNGVIEGSEGQAADADKDSQDDGDIPFQALVNLSATANRDLPFSEAVKTMGLDADEVFWLTRYVEGFNAADAHLISAAALKKQQHAEEAIEGDTSSKPVRGYGALVDFLAAECRKLGVEIQLGVPVRTILWREGEVVAVCDEQEFHAKRCVVTLPLGVLLSGNVQFQPEPEEIFRALRHMEMGSAIRISLLFKTRFWESVAPDLSFLIDRSADLTAWWTLNPAPPPLITGWAGGPRALQFHSAEQLLNSAIASLAKFFRRSEAELRAQLVGWHTHDWQSDPWSQGAYSYVRSGGLQYLPQLAEPLQDTLFFAGEHTDQEGHWGTVHAALTSGLRAASQILEAVGTPRPARA